MTEAEQPKRREITFAQAEGLEGFPSQLKPREVSQELRSLLWLVFFKSLDAATKYSQMGGPSYLGNQWESVLHTWHVRIEFRFSDEFKNESKTLIPKIKMIFEKGDYLEIFRFVEFVIRHSDCPYSLPKQINQALVVGRAAYRIADQSVIPVASEEEERVVSQALESLHRDRFRGARRHFLQAGEMLTRGEWAESIRESIHSVESVVTVLEPDAGSLSKALRNLERRQRIHGSLKAGFGSLYGYTSDERGIRHPLIDEAAADVDETDALYMFGACASFVTYLIGKSGD